MNISKLIAQRIHFGKQGSFSGFITKIAIAAVAVSLAVMLISTSVSRAFNATIEDKVFGFWGHIQISQLGSKQGVDETPLNFDNTFTADITKEPWVKSVNTFAIKPAILKTKEDVNGILTKGVGPNFDWESFADNVVEGTLPKNVNDCLVSTTIARKLQLKVGDKLPTYFIQKPVRSRAFIISGFYNTNLIEFDEKIMFVDLSHIQKLNGWEANEASGIEILVDNPKKASEYAALVRKEFVDFEKGVTSINQSQPEIFDWLGVISLNEKLILGFMILVALVNMISTLLVIILERTNMVGILKALGAPYSTIQNIFLRRAGSIIGIGLLLGNAIGLGLTFLQKKFELIKLDPESYYLDVVPIEFNWPMIIGLNIVTFFVILLSLLLPSLMIKRINPIKAIEFK